MLDRFLNFWIFGVVFFGGIVSNAQQDHVELYPLKEVLVEIENKFQCKFNYADEVVEKFYVPRLPQNFHLLSSLKFLEKHTGLHFTNLSTGQILIVPPKDPYLLCGYVLNDISKLPISSVLVKIEGKYTKTDSVGFFQIYASSKKFEINFSKEGFRSKSLLVQPDEDGHCLKIFLTPLIQNLTPVYLYNFITQGIYKRTYGGTEINLRHFGILPGLVEPDVLQTLQTLPSVESVNEKVSDLNVRGGTHDQNLVLWDGIRIYQTSHFFGLITAINPRMIKSVSLFKSGIPASYSNGVSSAIIMLSDTVLSKEIKVNAGVNFVYADAWSDIPVGKRSVLEVGIRKAISSFVQTPAYKQYYRRILQNTEVTNQNVNTGQGDIYFDFDDVSLKYMHQSKSDFWRINIFFTKDKFLFKKQAEINGIFQNKEGELSQQNWAEGFFWKRHWTPVFKSFFQVYETDYQLKAFTVDKQKGEELLQANIVSETSVKMWTQYQHHSGLRLINGYQFLENGTSQLTQLNQPPIKFFKREVIREHAIFSQINTNLINDKLDISVGFRLSYLDKLRRFIASPRFHFNYKIFNGFYLTLDGGFNHQFLTQIINRQTDFLGIEKRRWQLSNGKDVPVIFSRNISAGSFYKFKHWLFSLEMYYKKVDGITTQSQAFVNQYRFVQAIGSYLIKGMEVLMNKQTGNWSMWMSYTFNDNTYIYPGLEEKKFPNHFSVKHKVSSGISLKFKNLKTSLGLNWNSGKPFTEPDKTNPVTGGRIHFAPANSSVLPDYFRLDWSAEYRLKLKKNIRLELGASVWNITDRKNILNRYYQLDQNLQVVEYQQVSLGFTPNISLRLIWK